MNDMLEYHVTLLKLEVLKRIFERLWVGAKLKVQYHLNQPAPKGFDYVASNGPSIKKMRLISVHAFSAGDPNCDKPLVSLRLFHQGGHLLNGWEPTGGWTTDQALDELLTRLIELAPDRDGDNKIGEALVALR